jgi:hypothetical protein
LLSYYLPVIVLTKKEKDVKEMVAGMEIEI